MNKPDTQFASVVDLSIPRAEMLSQLADLICAVENLSQERMHPVRVAIDGVDGAGKTILADGLAPLVEKQGRPVIRATIDGFHNPREVRYQRGVDSPEGYYRDSFNYESLQRDLLIPLGPDGDRKYRPAMFNQQENAPIHEVWREAPANAILLFDGVFLLRPELIRFWDFSIFIEVAFSVSVPRAVQRDISTSAQKRESDTRMAHYERRYVPGQQIYFREARPREQASIIVDNNDYQNPSIITNTYAYSIDPSGFCCH